jgi:hypothetical protein
MKGDSLMLIPKTVDSFRATVRSLRSLDGTRVEFSTYCPGGSLLTPFVKNLSKKKPESIVREELKLLGIHVHSLL